LRLFTGSRGRQVQLADLKGAAGSDVELGMP
jgi:hypothetical protein